MIQEAGIQVDSLFIIQMDISLQPLSDRLSKAYLGESRDGGAGGGNEETLNTVRMNFFPILTIPQDSPMRTRTV